MTIERVRVLHGHTDMDSAYVVDDYPYGFRLRCKIRYWIETAAKGGAKGRQRFMSQTTNPKRAEEVWNKPKGSTYSAMAVMYLDGDDHVQWWAADVHLGPVEDARARLMGIYDQFTDDQRRVYDAMLTMFRRSRTRWDEWEERVNAIAEHIRTTGTDPEVTNGFWGRYYLYDAPEVFIAVARERLGT
jgi:hypothetical protein